MSTTTAPASRPTATTNYTLSLNDLAEWTNILSMQVKTGARPTLNDSACSDFAWWVSHFTMHKRYDYDGYGMRVNPNTPGYSIITNADLRKWMGDLFVQLGQFSVPAYNRPYYEIYTAWLWMYLLNSAGHVDCENVGGWSDRVAEASLKWTNGNMGDELGMIVQAHAASWSNPPALQAAVSVVATGQSNALKTLLLTKELTGEQCMYLMYLLLSIATGNADQLKSLQKVASAACNSMELPNSNLITSLVYFNLMQFADPMGAYAQTNPQILAIINELILTVTGTDPGSTALKAAMGTQAKILTVSANYPMVDPYNPAIGFNTRLSDMLEAINDSWTGLQS